MTIKIDSKKLSGLPRLNKILGDSINFGLAGSISIDSLIIPAHYWPSARKISMSLCRCVLVGDDWKDIYFFSFFSMGTNWLRKKDNPNPRQRNPSRFFALAPGSCWLCASLLTKYASASPRKIEINTNQQISGATKTVPSSRRQSLHSFVWSWQDWQDVLIWVTTMTNTLGLPPILVVTLTGWGVVPTNTPFDK